jgi:hypothetical protein
MKEYLIVTYGKAVGSRRGVAASELIKDLPVRIDIWLFPVGIKPLLALYFKLFC